MYIVELKKGEFFCVKENVFIGIGRNRANGVEIYIKAPIATEVLREELKDEPQIRDEDKIEICEECSKISVKK